MVLLECKTEKQNSQCEHGQPMEQTRNLFCTCNSGVARCQSPVSHLANEYDVRSELHRQVSLAVVNQSLCCSLGYERLQNSNDSLKDCYENVNIYILNSKLFCFLNYK